MFNINLFIAICLPECLNNGICVAPDQCNCPENFSGPHCQFENKPCLNFPPMPMNSKRSCRASYVLPIITYVWLLLFINKQILLIFKGSVQLFV